MGKEAHRSFMFPAVRANNERSNTLCFIGKDDIYEPRCIMPLKRCTLCCNKGPLDHE